MAEAERDRNRIVFMGTPGFARQVLERLLREENLEIIAVYTQPDRPCGRGLQCRPSEVKQLSLEHGLEIRQPANFKNPHELEQLTALKPDLLIVVAYGLILPQRILDVPRQGAINVHASLLPKHRGAAPIQRAIMNGEKVTGITIMQMDAGMDTGPILLQRALAIGIDDDAGTLHDQLAHLGGELLIEALGQLTTGTLKSLPQDDRQATYADKLTKADGEIRFDRPALEVHNHLRGVTPWPGGYFFCQCLPGRDNTRLTLLPGKLGGELPHHAKPGEITGLVDEHLAIATADRLYLVPRVCPEHRKMMDARSFYCGYMNPRDSKVCEIEP